MKKSNHIMMEGVPPNILHDAVKRPILDVKGVAGVFELHIWTIMAGSSVF